MGEPPLNSSMSHSLDEKTQSALAVKATCFPGYLVSLCGLCIVHALFEQRSGIVLVPSIMRDPHSLQRFPVGFALIAFLQSG